MRQPVSISSQTIGYWLALGWLGLVLVVGLAAHWLPLPYQGLGPDLLQIAAPPSTAHYMGTDALGRDVLAGLAAGAARLVAVSLPAIILAALLGAVAGGAAGFWGNTRLRLPLSATGWLGAALWWGLALPARHTIAALLILISLAISNLHRILTPASAHPSGRTLALPLDSLVLGAVTLLGSLPRLILLVALAAGPPLSSLQLLGLLILVAWPEPARVVRAEMLRVRVLPFIEATWASGLPAGRIWWHHALPAACLPLRTLVPLSLAGLIGLESTLAFLGIGQAPDAVSWGSLLATVRQDPSAWWVAVAPGLALLGTLLALQRVAAAPNHR